MDEFLIRHSLRSLDKKAEGYAAESRSRLQEHDQELEVQAEIVNQLAEENASLTSGMSLLRQDVAAMQKIISDLTRGLDKANMINIKQEIMIRTLHNLNAFDAFDMFVDTFASMDWIDAQNSIRMEWMVDYQSVGKTRGSTVEVDQSRGTQNTLLAKNGSADELLAQSFIIEKDKVVDRVSLRVGRFSSNTYLPLVVSLRSTINGPDLTSRDVTAAEAAGGWIEVNLPDYSLTAGAVYYIVLRTDDTYGYTVGYDSIDRYFSGTSFSWFNNLWTDNNYDLSFKVWCFPSADEDNATILSKPKTFATIPNTIVFDKEDTIDNTGSIVYYVSRDAGVNWKVLQPGIETSLDDLPEGKVLVLKGYITGSSRIDAWGYVVTRGDV